ncbi:MAG: orotidine-5'-phosphate decarboxylase [Gemmataceae bacterium]
MTVAFSDRLAEAVRRKGPLCVGIDPRWESLPLAIRTAHSDPARAFEVFSLKVLELVAPFSAVVKPQAAFFELLGPAGMNAMKNVLAAAKSMGFVTILDAKRGDIASTAEAYAHAAFGPTWDADSLTINPYLGRDAVEPFLNAAKAASRGVFVLVRTSNPGAGLFQDLNVEGRPLYRKVAAEVVNWNESTLGECDLGDVGAVVGATHPRELAELRAAMPKVWLLVPGYGAQGATAADVKAAYLPNGLGAVVNSSRGVTFPFKPHDADWESKIVEAARKSASELKT